MTSSLTSKLIQLGQGSLVACCVCCVRPTVLLNTGNSGKHVQVSRDFPDLARYRPRHWNSQEEDKIERNKTSFMVVYSIINPAFMRHMGICMALHMTTALLHNILCWSTCKDRQQKLCELTGFPACNTSTAWTLDAAKLGKDYKKMKCNPLNAKSYLSSSEWLGFQTGGDTSWTVRTSWRWRRSRSLWNVHVHADAVPRNDQQRQIPVLERPRSKLLRGQRSMLVRRDVLLGSSTCTSNQRDRVWTYSTVPWSLG